MSNMNRKLKRNKAKNEAKSVTNLVMDSNKKNENPYNDISTMKQICEIISLPTERQSAHIEIYEIDKELTIKDIVNGIGFVINDYKVFQNGNENIGFIDFIKNSVASNNGLSDSLSEIKFSKNKSILNVTEIEHDNNQFETPYYAFMYMDECEIYITGSTFYIYDFKSNKKYLYYAD